MKSQTTTWVAMIILAMILAYSPSEAQWNHSAGAFWGLTDGLGYQDFVADGAGGVVLVWSFDNYGSDDIFTVRLDDHGYAVWSASTVEVCTDIDQQIDPHIVQDGTGGFFVTWEDHRNGFSDIYGQRLSADGVPQWAEDGIPIASSTDTEASHEMISDGYGGIIVVWEQFTGSRYRIMAQRVGADGTPQWGEARQVASDDGGSLRYPELVLVPYVDESQTTVTVVYRDYRIPGNGGDIYAQRMNLNGFVAWGVGGAAVYAGAGIQENPQVVASSAGSSIISWRDERDTNTYGYCQKLNRFGTRQWGETGKQLSFISIYHANGIRMVSDGSNGAFIACGEIVHRLDNLGNTLWTEDIDIYSEAIYDINPLLLDDGDCLVAGWSYAVYPDPRIPSASRLDGATGDRVWNYDEVMLTDQARSGQNLALVSSGEGAYAIWEFSAFGGYFSVQRVDVIEGYWGYPTPVMTAVTDVPEDEGGWLNINIRATSNDNAGFPEEIATGYSVWRQVQSGYGTEAVSGQDVLGAIAAKSETAGMVVEGSDAQLLGLPEGNWQSLGSYPAIQEPYYDLVVPTRTDATQGSEPYEVFVVTAHTGIPTVHFTSNPDSAYSVDNLAPGLLQGLTGEAEYDPVSLNLSWQAMSESDLAHYVVHRGTSESFLPAETNLVAAPPETAWSDGEWAPDAGFHYKVAGLDRHGNVGGFATLIPGNVSSVSSGLLPKKVTLAQNHPNPFNPQTTIAFDLPSEQVVSLWVYDIAGRLINTLIDDETGLAGRNEVVWRGKDSGGQVVPAGVYFYRLKVGEYVETKRMTLLK